MILAFSPPRHTKRDRRAVAWGVGILLVVVAMASAAIIVNVRASRPAIASIDPPIGEPGASLRILGKHFKPERGEGRIEFDGAAPTTSSYLSWTDTEIRVRVPLYAESSLVRVVTDSGTSNSRIFMSRALLPSTPEGSGVQALGPTIESLSSDSGTIGAALSIRGLNFGTNRGDSAVLFSWIGESTVQAQNEESGRGYVSPQDAMGEYENWSDKEIRVRIPDGAVAGGIAVKTAKGMSQIRYFQIVESPGVKSFLGRKTYALSAFVTISRVKSSGQNSLYLWMPFPAEAPSQRGIKALNRSAEPLMPDYHGLSAYRLVDLVDDKLVTVSQDHFVQVYGIETDVKVDKIKAPPAPAPKLYTELVLADALVPADAPSVVAFAKKAVGREKNPYKIAHAVLEAFRPSLAFDAGAVSESPLKALATGKADAWDMSILYAAVLRAAGVPALPVAGVVVDDSRRSWRHAWAEFYVYGFGWIPVDPALALGATIGSFQAPFEDRAHYFGNMDDRHIAFSRGLSRVDRISPDGRTVSAARRYSFQNVFEEAAGGLSAYTSFWSDVEVTGVY